MRDKSADGRCQGGPPLPTGMSMVGMSVMGIGLRRTPAVLALGLLLSACSSGYDSSFSLFAEPGKYDYYSCDQIATQIKSWAQKEQELKTLMDRADQSAGGTAVGLIAYKADYVAAGEELDQLKATAHSKKCDQAPTWRSEGAVH